MANFSSNKRKRGRAADKLSVRLFLLDPEKETTKVTKEIGSEKGKNELKEKGCGPPRPEHCIAGETVEFSFDLTNVEFMQKIVEIYPILENGFFVFMTAGKDNILKELNPGRCCYRCYTPENVYDSERGQGRLYIRKIAENQISPCNHGKKRFGMIRILPKPSIATSAAVTSERQQNAVSSLAMATNQQLPVLGNLQTGSRMVLPTSSVAPLDLSSSSIIISDGQSSQAHSTVSTSRQLVPSTIAGIGLTPPPHNSVNIVTQNLLPSFNTTSIVSQMGSTPPVYNSVNVLPQSQLQSVINCTVSRPPVFSTSAMTTTDPFLLPGVLSTPPTPSMVSPVTMATLNPSTSNTNTIRLGRSVTPGIVGTPPRSSMVSPATVTTLFSPSIAAFNASATTAPDLSQPSPWTSSLASMGQLFTMSALNQLPTPRSLSTDFSSGAMTRTGSNMVPGNNFGLSSGVFQTDNNTEESSAVSGNEVIIDNLLSAALSSQSPALYALADATVGRGPLEETVMSDTRGWTNPLVQENNNITEPELNIDAVLESIKSTEKLEMSLTILNGDHFLKKLNESTINIHTVEIQSTCKLKEVLKKYSLPPCLKYLRITDNNLDYEDIFSLIRSLSNVESLRELHLFRTRFRGSSFNCFLSVLIECSDVQSLCLTDNGLTEEERNCLVTTFSSMKNLKNLNLTKNNITEAQANHILQKHGEGKTTVSLDLSQNALEGDEIISKICKLKSLEELNLSHNHIRFPQLRSLDEESDNFFTNVKIISLSSNNMTSDDICLFPSWIRSDLVSLTLDLNHVGCSIWSVCSLRIRHLKVLSLANTDVSGPAVQGLTRVLTSARELEELNLSSNNLMSEDFQQLLSPLSSLTKLKKLNLSNNHDGVSVVLEKILRCIKCLEDLRISNTHLNGDECNKFFESLSLLKELKYLDLSNNAIGLCGALALSDISKEFPLLEGLDLSECCIQEDEIRVLCAGLIPLKKLKCLNLSGNRIDADEFLADPLFLPLTLEEVILSDIIHGEKLFHSMIPLQFRLRKLHLSEMKLRPRDVEALAIMLSSFFFLEELVLTDVHFTDRNCEKIFDAIGKIKNLKKLVLSGLTLDNKKAFFDMLSCLSVLEEIVFPRFVIDRSDTGCVNVLQSLVYLKNLDLSQNAIYSEAFTDILPAMQLLERLVLRSFWCDHRQLFVAVGKLKYLKELDLFRSDVDEFGAIALAEVLPSLQLLEILALGYVDFDERSYKQLFLAVAKLKYLKKLSLSYRVYGSTDLIPLTEVLPSLRFLEELTLKGLGFDDGIETQLFHAIGRLQYLKKLNLCDSNIVKTDVIHLAKVLPSLQWLEEVELGDLDTDDDDDDDDDECNAQLFCAIRELKYLKKLTLLFSGLTNLISLARTIPSLQWLEELKLKNCFSNDESNTQLFHAVGNLKYLKKFTFKCFGCTHDYKALAEVLPSFQFLEKLELGKSKNDDESDTKLFKALGNLKYLKKLALQQFRLTQIDAVAALSEALVSLPLLEKLVLEWVKFDDGCDVQLFHAVGKLKYLKVLKLQLTDITQAGAVFLTNLLPTLDHLRKFLLPSYIKSDDEVTSIGQALEKSTALRNELQAAACRIPGLKVC